MANYREQKYSRQGREDYDRSRRYGRERDHDKTSRNRSDYNRGVNRDYDYNRDFESPRFRSGGSNYDYGYGIQSDYDYDLGRESAAGETFTGGNYGSGYVRREDYNRNKEQKYDNRSGIENYSRGMSSRDRDYERSNYGYGGSSRYNEPRYSRSDYNARDYEAGGSSRYGSDYSNDYTDYGDYDRNRYDEEDRGWWDKASDEVASWFGDEDATRRRRIDARRKEGDFTGRGPKNYKRSDERIKEDINDRLSFYSYIDASDVDIEVNNGEVILTGTVIDRWSKRRAEDIAESVSGVNNVENRLRVKREDYSSALQTNTTVNTTGVASYGSNISSVNRENKETTGTNPNETSETNAGLSRKAKTT